VENKSFVRRFIVFRRVSTILSANNKVLKKVCDVPEVVNFRQNVRTSPSGLEVKTIVVLSLIVVDASRVAGLAGACRRSVC